MSRTSLRLTPAIALIAGIASALALSGCAAPTHPSQGSAHSHTGSGTTGSHATPTPTSTTLAAPVSRIPLACSQLAPDAAIAAAVGKVLPGNDPTPADLDEYNGAVFQQDGALVCGWSDNPNQDLAQGSNHVEIWIDPDITPAQWAYYLPVVTDGLLKGKFAGDSHGDCQYGATDPTVCDLDTYVGTTWLRVEVESLTKRFASATAAVAQFTPLMKNIVTAVQGATVAEPRWTDPDATLVPTTCPGVLTAAQLLAASGVKIPFNYSGLDRQSYSPWGAEADTGLIECDWSVPQQSTSGGVAAKQYSVYIQILPSGAWYWSQNEQQDSSQPGYATLPALGSQVVTYTANNGGIVVTIDGVAGHNLFDVQVSPVSSGTRSTAIAQALTKDIIAELTT